MAREQQQITTMWRQYWRTGLTIMLFWYL